MIYAAVSHIASQLNQFLRRSFDLTEDMVVLSNILEQDGTVAPDVNNKLVVFVVNGVRPDISVRDIFKGIWPFIFADTITLAILTAFPQIVTFIVEVSD